jgi:hypothetical protein
MTGVFCCHILEPPPKGLRSLEEDLKMTTNGENLYE